MNHQHLEGTPAAAYINQFPVYLLWIPAGQRS